MVGGEDEGVATAMATQEVPYLASCERVHPRRGFVQDDSARVSQEGHHDGELPLHSTREVLGERLVVARQAYLAEPSVCMCVCV